MFSLGPVINFIKRMKLWNSHDMCFMSCSPPSPLPGDVQEASINGVVGGFFSKFHVFRKCNKSLSCDLFLFYVLWARKGTDYLCKPCITQSLCCHVVIGTPCHHQKLPLYSWVNSCFLWQLQGDEIGTTFSSAGVFSRIPWLWFLSLQQLLYSTWTVREAWLF